MAKKGKENNANFKLKQPDRSVPSDETLLGFAEKAGILNVPQQGEKKVDEDDDDPLVGRLGDAMLWSTSLTMLHFTLDVLVMSQYASDWERDKLLWRTLQAFPVFLFFFYTFHPHPSPSIFLPQLSSRVPTIIHQIFFFICSVSTGCYLIHITNNYSYYAIMKQSPPLGCLWIWSVIELDIFWAPGSLVLCGIFLKAGGYSIS